MILLHLIKDECPYCHKGKVFENSNLFSYKTGKMNEVCQHCHSRFVKEPGFYWGAMYASYGLAVLEGFLAYFICRLFGTGMTDWVNLIVIVFAMLFLAPFNFRMARLIWLYIFYRLD